MAILRAANGVYRGAAVTTVHPQPTRSKSMTQLFGTIRGVTKHEPRAATPAGNPAATRCAFRRHACNSVRRAIAFVLMAGTFAHLTPAAVSAQVTSQSSRNPSSDTAKIHGDLRGAIRDFQDEWRRAWKVSHDQLHKPLNMVAIRGLKLPMEGGRPVEITGDLENKIMTPDVKRYLAVMCFAGSASEEQMEAARNQAFLTNSKAATPGQPLPRRFGLVAYAADGVTAATGRQITPRPNNGAQCPAWIPSEADTPPDEGEAIDLALTTGRRPEIRQQREALIRKLDVAQAAYPWDEWITGQRVRFVNDQRDHERTLHVARTCESNTSWCFSLRAFAEQQGGNIEEAEAAFRRADTIDAMARDISNGSCLDQETLWLFRGGDRSDVTGLPCAQQRALVNRMWWLADPLWSVPGNDRYVAHDARRLHATLRAVNDRDERYPWFIKGGGDGMRELVVRYGWPSFTYWPGLQLENDIDSYFEHNSIPLRINARPYTAKEYRTDRASFLPVFGASQNPFDAIPESWQLYPPEGAPWENWWPQEHMSYLFKIADLPAGQDAQWRRDAFVSYQLVIDSPLHHLDPSTSKPSQAVLMGGVDATSTRQIGNSLVTPGNPLKLRAQLKSTPIVLSAEIVPRTEKDLAMRLRFGLQPPPTLSEMSKDDYALSVPVFMRMPSKDMEIPTGQTEVVRYMTGSLSFANTEQLAIYWESYGFVPGDSVQVELKIRRNDNVNVARRIGSVLGVVSALRDSISIKWTEPDARRSNTVVAGAKPIVGRSIAMDVSALDAGDYVVIMEMRKGTTIRASSERAFSIKKREQ